MIPKYDALLIDKEEDFEGWNKQHSDASGWFDREREFDLIVDYEEFLNSGSVIDQSDYWDRYSNLNNEKTFLADVNADKISKTSYSFYVGSTEIQLFNVDQDFTGEEWESFQLQVGAALLWRELVKNVDSQTLMERLGFYWIGE